MLGTELHSSFESCGSQSRFEEHNIRAMSIDLQLNTQTSNKLQERLSIAQLRQEQASLAHSFDKDSFFLSISGTKGLWISFVVESSLQHLTAVRDTSLSVHFYGQSKAVEKLRAQATLFWIHRPDERKACRVTMRDPLTLYMIDAHRCDI